MRRTLRLAAGLATGLAVGAGTLAALPAVAKPEHHPKPPVGFWVAGDLHVHTIYGHDTCITPTEAWDPDSTDRAARTACEDPYVVGFAPATRLDDALDRGLDFVALTDHNNVVNQTDPDVIAWKAAHPDFAVVPAYENSQPGHVQMLGARACYAGTGDIRGSLINCDKAVTDRSTAGETALAGALRDDGGVFQVNHPSDGNWRGKFHHDVVPDTVEVWNIGVWAFQPPAPSSNDNDQSLRWYDGFLRDGERVAVTGGSDSHWVSTSAVQGIGEPTTWVFVKKLTVQGVLDGLRAHRTFVSALPPAMSGPQLFLEADRDGDGVYEAIAGSETRSTATFRVRVVGALPGSMLRIVTENGGVQHLVPASGVVTFRPGAGDVPVARRFVRAELLAKDGVAARRVNCDPVVGGRTTLCRNPLLMQALTSPIYID